MATVVVDDSTVYEPDVTVTCESNVDMDATTVLNPCLLVDVLSPSTQGVDTGGKLAGYFSLESVRHYILVDPKKRQVVVHTRQSGEIASRISNQGNFTVL